MKFLKMTGLLMVLSMLAVGCSSDDDDDVKGGEPAELYVYVRDASDNYLLEGVDVEFVQNNKVLGIDTTDDTGLALCDNKWDGLVSGSVTINIHVDGYESFTKTGNIKPGENEWEVSLTPAKGDEPISSLTVTSKNVEDLYGTISILIPAKAKYVRVSEGSTYNPENYTEYKNVNYESGTTTQNITYNNLVPDTKYVFTVVSFNGNNKQLEKKSISITTKALYNRSDANIYVTDFMTLSNGISVTLGSRANVYFACYEKTKAPTDENQIIKDAFSATEMQENTDIGYVSGLQPGKQYRLYIIPVAMKYTNSGSVTFYAPGTISDIDVTTKSAAEIAAAVPERVTSDKNSLTYRFKKMNGCYSYRAITLNDYDKYENLPDIAMAILCLKGNLDTFGNAIYSSNYSWGNLNLTSWYGIISLGYTNSNGSNNSGIVSRYKFKYGNYGVTTRANASMVSETSGIEYGSISDDLLKQVRVLQ
nr:fibronectin type III domain-containing protein [uncultured Bacteroides sp.]